MSDDIKREYELAVLVDNETAEKDIDKILSGLSDEAEIIGRESSMTLQLSYPIKKHSSAALLVYYLRLLPKSLIELKNNLSFQANVLRFLVITPPIRRANAKKKAEPAEVKKSNQEISSTEELAKTLEQLQ